MSFRDFEKKIELVARISNTRWIDQWGVEDEPASTFALFRYAGQRLVEKLGGDFELMIEAACDGFDRSSMKLSRRNKVAVSTSREEKRDPFRCTVLGDRRKECRTTDSQNLLHAFGSGPAKTFFDEPEELVCRIGFRRGQMHFTKGFKDGLGHDGRRWQRVLAVIETNRVFTARGSFIAVHGWMPKSLGH